jgi:import inner membrane translocase subunit TIM9
MSQLCFNQCVWDFGTSQIRNREARCALNCTENYMKATKMMGESFAPSSATVSQGLGV